MLRQLIMRTQTILLILFVWEEFFRTMRCSDPESNAEPFLCKESDCVVPILELNKRVTNTPDYTAQAKHFHNRLTDIKTLIFTEQKWKETLSAGYQASCEATQLALLAAENDFDLPASGKQRTILRHSKARGAVNQLSNEMYFGFNLIHQNVESVLTHQNYMDTSMKDFYVGVLNNEMNGVIQIKEGIYLERISKATKCLIELEPSLKKINVFVNEMLESIEETAEAALLLKRIVSYLDNMSRIWVHSLSGNIFFEQSLSIVSNYVYSELGKSLDKAGSANGTIDNSLSLEIYALKMLLLESFHVDRLVLRLEIKKVELFLEFRESVTAGINNITEIVMMKNSNEIQNAKAASKKTCIETITKHEAEIESWELKFDKMMKHREAKLKTYHEKLISQLFKQ